MPAPPTAATLLDLIWLASPALPVGGFSYSEGLEAAVDTGRIRNEETASDWLSDQLALGLGRADLPLIAQAHTAWQTNDFDRVRTLNDWLLSSRESAELRRQTEQMGRSMLDWMRNDAPDLRVDLLARLRPAPSFQLAFALACVRAGAAVRDTLLSHGFGWAENMVQAAIKAVPLGQAAGQRILRRLARELPDCVERALAMDDDARQSFTPMLAILSSRHETQYSRLFRS